MYYDLATLIDQTRNKIDSNDVSFYGIILSVKKSPSFENLRIVTFTLTADQTLIAIFLLKSNCYGRQAIFLRA